MPEGRLPPSVFLEIACGPTACNLFILCHVGRIDSGISGTSPPSIASNKFRYFSRLSVSGRLAGLTMAFFIMFRRRPAIAMGAQGATLHAPMGCLL